MGKILPIWIYFVAIASLTLQSCSTNTLTNK